MQIRLSKPTNILPMASSPTPQYGSPEDLPSPRARNVWLHAATGACLGGLSSLLQICPRPFAQHCSQVSGRTAASGSEISTAWQRPSSSSTSTMHSSPGWTVRCRKRPSLELTCRCYLGDITCLTGVCLTLLRSRLSCCDLKKLPT